MTQRLGTDICHIY